MFDDRHQRLLPYLACEGCRSTAITTQTKAANVTMALAACEYSHWIRNLFQFLGTTVQLLVARFVGKVQTKKMARLVAIAKMRRANSRMIGPACAARSRPPNSLPKRGT